MMQNPEALDRHPHLQRHLDTILEIARDSSMKARSIRAVQDVRKIYQRSNEASLTNNLIPLIIKLRRSARNTAQAQGHTIQPQTNAQLTVPMEKDEDAAKDDEMDVAFYEDGIVTPPRQIIQSICSAVERAVVFLPILYTEQKPGKGKWYDDTQTRYHLRLQSHRTFDSH